ncbi:hypothetical protein NHF46_22630 [Arthrobacter alpinus]|nr:hypothetical protein [Arthrobacter alpinus]
MSFPAPVPSWLGNTTPPRRNPLRWGVNYTPSAGWFHSWQDFDVDAVRADFESIAALGLDHVRIFPLWPLLQPNRALIRAAGIADVGRVVDAAAEFGLDVSVDGLQGHLSSYDFLPAWVTSWHRRNIYTDPLVVEAEAQLITALAKEVTTRPNVLGMTLGNETNQFAVERHPDQQLTTPAEMGEWFNTLWLPPAKPGPRACTSTALMTTPGLWTAALSRRPTLHAWATPQRCTRGCLLL